MNIYVKKFSKAVLGLLIMVISFFPVLMGSSFFLMGCDFKEWTAMFTDPEGIPMSKGLIIAIMALITVVFIGICVYGYYLAISAAKTSDEEMTANILDALVKYRQEEQAKCSHDTVHQVDFSNLLKCDECGATFENKHFVAE